MTSLPPPTPAVPRTVASPHTHAVEAVRSVSSEALLKGARELVIRHPGGEYRLRLTRNDKLILTK